MDESRVAAKSFILNDEGKLLVIKRSSADRYMPELWELPGGKMKPGEDPITGVKRETKEETNLDIDVLHPFSVRHFSTPEHTAITLLIYFCRPLSNDIKLSKEHTHHEWVSIEKSKELLAEFFHLEVDLFNKLKLDKHF